MPIFKTCPTCGTSTPLTVEQVKEFAGIGVPVIDLPESLAEMVDGIIERTGYGGSVD